MSSTGGAVALMLVLAVTVTVVVATAALTAGADLAATAVRARAAADAAALAGAGTSPLVSADGGDPLTAARRVAHANGARLVATGDDGWPLRFRVTVDATPRTRWVRRFVGTVRASAVAGVRPRTGRSPPGRAAGLRAG